MRRLRDFPETGWRAGDGTVTMLIIADRLLKLFIRRGNFSWKLAGKLLAGN
jgi:hypothetical protein